MSENCKHCGRDVPNPCPPDETSANCPYPFVTNTPRPGETPEQDAARNRPPIDALRALADRVAVPRPPAFPLSTPVDQSWADAAIKDTPAPAPASYPDDNPKTLYGVRKPAMSAIPPVALIHLMKAMADGRNKYGLMNWREKKVSFTIYYDAAMRHMMSAYDGEELASDSKVKHLAHAMACMAILLDAEACGMLNDDRPLPGKFAELCAEMTES